MQPSKVLQDKLAELVALRIVHQREELVHFLRTRTNRLVPQDIDNAGIAHVLSEMIYDDRDQDRAMKVILGQTEYLNIAPLLLVGVILSGIGAIAGVVQAVRVSQEERESAISGLTLQQIEYDKAIVENRQKMSQEFLANVLANEREIQVKKQAIVAQEGRQKIIYLLIFIAILTTSFALILNKK
jgi:hypothetical protein